MLEAVSLGSGFLLNDIKLRITERGEMSNESPLAPYSTKPWNFKREDFVKRSAFQPKKPGQKTMYLEQGYKELRDIQGFRTDITNLKYSGDLIKSMIAFKESPNSFVLKFNSSHETIKSIKLEKQYGAPIFSGSVGEINRYENLVTDYANIHSPLIF